MSVAVVEALLDADAAVNAQNKHGKTALHLVQSPAMARVLLKHGGDAFEIADDEGRTAFESQTPKIRDFLLDETLFCGRFEVPSFRSENPAKPEHATDTSVVLRSTDKFPGTDKEGKKYPRDVVLKLMKHKKQFDSEINQRIGLNTKFILKVIYNSTDDGLASKWMNELPPAYQAFEFGIVMPAAERTLMIVLLSERVDLPLAKTMFASFARALGHLHEKGLIQGDFKPGNTVRMPDGTWILIDLDGAVKIGAPIGAKALSTAFMPPEATHIQGDEVVFRVPKEGASYEPLAAYPTLDLWSFMAVLFRVITHKPLLEADDRDNLRSKRELMVLATWGAKALSNALADADTALVADGVGPFERLVACDLLGWGLQEKPEDRPQSSEEVLAHPFFFDEARAAAAATKAVQKDEQEEKKGVEETKNGEAAAEETIPAGLHMPPLHAAAALGDLPTIESTLTGAVDAPVAEALNVREPLLGRRPLHFAVVFVQPNVVRFFLDTGADVKAEDDAGMTPLDLVPSVRERHQGDAETQAALNEIEEMLTTALLALSLPFLKSLPPHLNVEVVAQALAKAAELAMTGTGENTACIGFTIVVCDAQVLLRKDEEGDGVYGEVSQDAFDFSQFMAKGHAIWTVEGFKQLQACATQVRRG